MEKKGLALLNIAQPEYDSIQNVIQNNPNFQLELITGSNANNLIQEGLSHKVNTVVTEVDEDYQKIDDQLWEEDIKTYVGSDAIAQSCENENIHMVINGYDNLMGLKASVFALKAKKLTFVQRSIIMQTGHFLSQVAKENQALLIPASNQLYFFWQTLLNLDWDAVDHIQIIAPKDQVEDTLIDCICLFKLIPPLLKSSVSIAENKQESRSAIAISYISGEQNITSQKCSIEQPMYLISPIEKIGFELYNTASIETLDKEQTDTVRNWSSNDLYALQNPLVKKKELFSQLNAATSKAITDTKISTIQDIQDVLTASNRTDLNS